MSNYIINSLKHDYKFETIIITGGIASNSTIRNIVTNNFKNNLIIFQSIENSSDNAVGNAYLPIIDRWYHETKTN